eukprot:gene16501-22727_t
MTFRTAKISTAPLADESSSQTSMSNSDSSSALSSFDASSPPAQLPLIVRVHDYLNLVLLALLNIFNARCIITGNGFYTFWYLTMLYFIWDFGFVAIWPKSVKSPAVILVHHAISGVYLLIPYHYPQCMCYCMLVEINTWLLIAKRSTKSIFLEIGFYASWVVLRNIMYPYLIYAFYKEWQSATLLFGTPWNPILICPLFQTFLTALNYHWTLDLLNKTIAPKKEKSKFL